MLFFSWFVILYSQEIKKGYTGSEKKVKKESSANADRIMEIKKVDRNQSQPQPSCPQALEFFFLPETNDLGKKNFQTK